MISSNVINLLFATSAWLSSPNAAELCLLPDSTEQVSYAETFVHKDNGHWIDYSGSADSYQWGVRAASVYRVDSRWVLDGQVEYTNFTGRKMSGSVWICPEERPFDIIEPTRENAGTKNLETYRLAGGVSAEFHRLALGFRMDLTSANYAKQKDLRHQNKLMDLTATAGLLWHLNYRWSLGADFNYRRTIEELTFRTFGTTDRKFLSLIDYGGAFGVSEYSSSYGLTDENVGRPWVENRFGTDWQLNARDCGGMNWYNDLHFDYASGYYGRKSLFTPVFMEHEGIHWSYRTRIGIGCHQVGFGLTGSHVTNERKLFQYTTDTGGVNEYSYYGKLETCRRDWFDVMLSYQCTLSDWMLDASFTHANRGLIASYYPYYRQQDLHYSSINLSARRLWRQSLNDWSLTLQTGYSQGGGNRADDGLYSDSENIASTNLYTSDLLLNQHADYLIARQGNIGLSCEYGRQLKQAPVRLYVTLQANWLKAWDTTFHWEDTYRQRLGLAVGCSF